MSSVSLVEHKRSLKVHVDPGGGITMCGWPCWNERWTVLGGGSVYDCECKRCIAALKKDGDL